MEYTIVNGAGAIARGVTKALSKNANKVRLLDTNVYRAGVHRLQEDIEPKANTNFTQIEKVQTPNSKSLEYAIEGSDTVIYFTHDYPSMSFAKGSLLEATAKAAKTTGVSKLVCVCPIESDLYYTEGSLSPVDIKNQSEDKAFSAYPDLVMLHPNLVFGEYSYFVRYITQSVIAGKIHKSLADPSDKTSYFPVHYEDLTEVIKHAVDNYESVSGKTFSVKGAHDTTLVELKSLIERQIEGHKVDLSSNLGVCDFFTEYFRGIGHDQNMCLMAEFFKKNSWEFTHDNDYHMKNGVEHHHAIQKYKKEQDLSLETHIFPIFSGYKNSALD
jgi:hypothetical protein